MALVYRQDYKVTWVADSIDGTFRLVCWDDEWNIFLNKKHIGTTDSFQNSLEFIGSYNANGVSDSNCCESGKCTCKGQYELEA